MALYRDSDVFEANKAARLFIEKWKTKNEYHSLRLTVPQAVLADYILENNCEPIDNFCELDDIIREHLAKVNNAPSVFMEPISQVIRRYFEKNKIKVVKETFEDAKPNTPPPLPLQDVRE